MKLVKQSLDHIELVSSGDTALFEIRLVVAMHDWSQDEADDCLDELGALDWLLNLMQLASDGKDIKTGADAFLRATLTLDEQRVYLAKVETINLKEEQK